MNLRKQFLFLAIIGVPTFIFYSCSSQKELTKATSTQPLKLIKPVCTVTDKTDEFTKQHYVYAGPYQFYDETIDLTLSTLKDWNYQANSKQKSTELAFYVQPQWVDGKKYITIMKGVFEINHYLDFPYSNRKAKIFFLLSNDETLTLIPNKDVESSELIDGWLFQTETFEVDDSTWSKLRDFNPKKFRITYYGDNLAIYEKDFVIDEKNKSQIQFAIKCIDDLNLQKK